MKQHTQFFDPNSEHLDLLLAVGEIGVWELNVRTGEARRNLRHDQIFGYQELLPEWTYPMFLDQVAPQSGRANSTSSVRWKKLKLSSDTSVMRRPASVCQTEMPSRLS